MKKLVIAILVFVCINLGLFAWSWGSYSKAVNKYMKNTTDENALELMEMYNSIITDAEESLIGPGVYADYGYFLAIQGDTEKAVEMFKMEIQQFPESERFVAKLIEEVTGEPYPVNMEEKETEPHPGLSFLPATAPDSESETQDVAEQNVQEEVEQNEN